MGKCRTCVNTAKSASSSGSVANKSAKSFPNRDLAENYGSNTRGKFEGNSVNYQRRSRRRPILVTIYALALTASYLCNSFNANAQPIFGNRKNLSDISAGDLVISQENGGEDLLGSIKNCSIPSAADFPGDLFSLEARRHGAVFVHFVVTVYLFYAVLLVCDEYFIPAVECICREKKIPSDLAGATFMAISTSSPELFTNMIGTFMTDGDLGVGTIVGSAVFNILAIGALCGIGVGYSIKKLEQTSEKIGVRLEWWPLTRDSFFYLISVGTLVFVLRNRRVYWYEALLMILLYALYILVLCFNATIKGWVEQILAKFFFVGREEPRRIGVIILSSAVNEKTPLLLKVTEKSGFVDVVPKQNGFQNGGTKYSSSHDLLLSKEYDIPASSLDELLVQTALSRSNSFCVPVEEEALWCKWPGLPEDEEWSLTSFLGFMASYPIRFVLWCTIPDCKVYAFRKWYYSTLALCVLWIGGLTYLISWMVTIIGETFSIPDSVTGLTFLAAGTSIPEVISSLIVARQGLGAMCFSNTIGSNTFDILICLGLPWLLKALIMSNSEVNYVEIHSAGMEFSAILLISALVILYLFIALNGFILDKKIGISCFFMYIVFITLACMLELNVFFPVNLPPC